MFHKKTLLAAAITITTAVAAQTDADTTRQTQLEEVVLSAIRARQNVPVTQFNLSSTQLKQLYYGADLPVVLQRAPSIHGYSDNGTGIGYSFFRLRGLDQSRINLTVNGVPVNDPENQGTFFNNFADLASSAQSVQVQRGVGTSTNGAAAFGGSVNIQSRNLSEQPGAEINLGFGSFNSRRLTAEVQTGRMGKYATYVRLSNLATDGYRERSGSEISSYFISVGRFGNKSLLKFNMWGGDAQSQLAYTGIDKATLSQNRRANPFTLNESDRFRQNFFQLQYQYSLSRKSGINASAYYARGVAPQFQVFFAGSTFFPYSFYNMPNPIVGNDTLTQTDAKVSYRLDQHFYGGFASYYYHTRKLQFDAGVHANSFSSDHFMETQWMQNYPSGIAPNQRAYFNTGFKQEASAFAKINYYLTPKFNLYADLQMRYAAFQYEAQTLQYAAPPFGSEDMSWTFINPKAGAQYAFSDVVSIYGMAGITSREPTRFDYFQDDYATRDVKQDDIKPEMVTDIEAGVKVNRNNLQLNANVYYMLFDNAIINTGDINAFGYPITTNVKTSTRAGIEVDAIWKVHPKLHLMLASVFSKNTIADITQYYSDSNFASVGINYKNTTPALTPSIISNQGIRYIPFKFLYVDLNVRYVGEQFVDNSATEEARINAYTLTDLQIGLSLKQWLGKDVMLRFQVNNLLEEQFVTWGNTALFSNVLQYDNSGNTRGTITPLYFAAPGRNYFLSLQVKF
jgi:iron complex outermembrane receptor protein